ncbi:cation:dicarboxylase symporter family transporter [bacterium]|nr:cation:dicarboxylase symporter family transporter [bacterium]
MKLKLPGLAVQILLGLIAGALFGHFLPQAGVSVQPLGDAFIRMIKMIVVPIVFSTVILGVAGVGDLKRVGKLGGLSLLYFEIVTTVAIVLGVGSAYLFKPGHGVSISGLARTDVSQYTSQHHDSIQMLLHIIPTNILQSAANGELLPIIFFSVLFGVALAGAGAVGRPVVDFLHGVSDAMFKLTNMIMKVAPIGVFGLVAATIGKYGIGVLVPLGKLVGTLYITMAFFVLVVLGAIAYSAKIPFFRLLKLIGPEMLLAFSTASSETVLPRIMQKLERFGCPKGIVSFVVPTGYTFNLDGSSLYQGLAVAFIAQVYGLHLGFGQLVSIVLVLMLTSKGIAGVPGVSFVVLAATLSSTGLPVEGLALIAGVDRFMDMGRTVVNVIGNSLAACVISRVDGGFDDAKPARSEFEASIPEVTHA